MFTQSQYRPYLYVFFALLAIATWRVPQGNQFWSSLDVITYKTLSSTFLSHHGLHNLLAFLNTRWFDAIAGLIMIQPFIWGGWVYPKQELKTRLIECTLIIAGIIIVRLLCKWVLEFERPSPSRVIGTDTAWLFTWSWLQPKVDTGNSFPGDHAAIAIGWAMYILHTARLGWGLVALGVAGLLMVPRLAIGAHWLTDNLMGGLPMALLAFPAVYHTPLLVQGHRIASLLWQKCAEIICTQSGNK